jgi:hypothetical protein
MTGLQINNQTTQAMPAELEAAFQRCDNPAEAWASMQARSYLTDLISSWLAGMAEWKVFLTLTFREDKAPDVANAYWKRLVRELNQELYGKHYTKKVHHSYFSYVLGVEYQRRDVIHFHAIADKPLNFKKIHTLWNDWAGFVWTDIIKDKRDCVRYVAKYTLKGGSVDVYEAKRDFIPDPLPSWWKLPEAEQLSLLDGVSGEAPASP